MKKVLLTSSLLASLLFVGCSPENQTNGNVGATATTNSACPAGSWYQNGQCYNSNGTSNSTFNFNNGYYADNYSGTSSLALVNGDKLKELFKLGMGICDRGAKNYQNLGSANCSYYVSGTAPSQTLVAFMDIILQFPQQLNGNALITIIAKPKVSPYGVTYSGQLPSGWGLLGIALGYVTGYTLPDPTYYQGAMRNPLQIQAAVSPINNSTGFVAQGYGDAWTGLNQTLVTVEIGTGSANSTSLNYVLKIGGAPAATGVMSRCQYQNCGL